MEVLLGGEKTPQVLSDYKEYNTDTTIRFVVSVVDGKVNEVRKEGPHKMFKLQSSLATTSMVLFDHLGCLRKFNNVDEIMQEFYTLRIDYYDKRRKYLVGMLQVNKRWLLFLTFILTYYFKAMMISNKQGLFILTFVVGLC